MAHWLDRLALRSAAGSPAPGALQAAGTPTTPIGEGEGLSRRGLIELGADEATARLPLALSSMPTPPLEGPFSRRTGLRTLGLAAGLLLATPLRTFGPSNAGAASLEDCVPNCLGIADEKYRRSTVICNSLSHEPRDFLLPGGVYECQVRAYKQRADAEKQCKLPDCGRKKPPPPAPPLPKRGPPPPPPGGCRSQGLTSCGDTCCPAGSLCSSAGCIPPPPPPCNPACPPGKKCQNGQCVDASSPCGVCPSGSPCCTCSYGSYCGNPDLACRC